MNFEIKQTILNKIKEYDTIMLFRHVRNDGDCVGATKGMKSLITATWPEKTVYVIDADTAQYLEFMGPEDPEVADEVYEKARYTAKWLIVMRKEYFRRILHRA